MPRVLSVLVSLSALATGLAQAAASFTAPLPYVSAVAHPLGALGPYSYQFLETFESGSLLAPGVSASAGFVNGPGPATDSVDADDGLIDGQGLAGHSWYSGDGSNFIRFSFNAASLGGSLPTAVGLVFTDLGRVSAGSAGFGQVLMEVFDASGVSQGSFSFTLGDGSVNGATAEDRFLGASYAAGIGSIRVGFVNSSDWEVDHLFFAAAAPIPEPASAALLLAGLVGIHARRRRQSTSR